MTRYDSADVTLHLGDCLEVLRTMPPASVDAVVTDPPYACIDRQYGWFSEDDWHQLIDAVVEECRRVLTPKGSAMFVIQPNSERVGRMRPWVWDFLAKWSRRWGVVQDAYWWNFAAFPVGSIGRKQGLMRSSLKYCIWLGPSDCYRNQDAVLWQESQRNVAERLAGRMERRTFPSGLRMRPAQSANVAAKRGGVTPFNVLPIPNTNSQTSAGAHGHGAGTPIELMRWWTRYTTPPGGTVLDPFIGSGTLALAARKEGRKAIGIERDPQYFQTAIERIESASPEETGPTLFDELPNDWPTMEPVQFQWD